MKDGTVYVSRVDGNHRLWHASGDDRREPLLAEVPFQIHVGLTQDQERSLFVDINSNQKGLSSSHLAVMQNRLSPDEIEIRDHLDRWISARLSKDPISPWHGLIHEGGSKKGVSKLLSKSQYIHDLGDAELQYVIVRDYWQAAKAVFAEEWANPKEYLLLRNIGVLSLSILAASVIDRCIALGRVEVADFARYLGQTRRKFDWSDSASGERAVKGMSGNQAALIIAGEMAAELTDESGSNAIRDIQERLRMRITQPQ
jgi:hypothetical protein